MDPRDLVPDARGVGPHANRFCVHQALDRLDKGQLVVVSHVVPLDPDFDVAASGDGLGLIGGNGGRDLGFGTAAAPFHDFHGLIPGYGADLGFVRRDVSGDPLLVNREGSR